jgi:hypothetical protein
MVENKIGPQLDFLQKIEEVQEKLEEEPAPDEINQGSPKPKDEDEDEAEQKD